MVGKHPPPHGISRTQALSCPELHQTIELCHFMRFGGHRFQSVRKKKWAWTRPTSYSCLMIDLILTLWTHSEEEADLDSTIQKNIQIFISRIAADNTLISRFLEIFPQHELHLLPLDRRDLVSSIILQFYRPESWPHSWLVSKSDQFLILSLILITLSHVEAFT